MTTDSPNEHAVAVIGAGPAGIYAARELARRGMPVALLNRDIKPGGLAEYGIYFTKHKMKNGLRKQFREALAEEGIHYFGNVVVGEDGGLRLKDLQAMGFAAILVTVGAQGTKWLGLPGEELKGAFHAKDLVYHYNQLPPFSEQRFAIGERVVCVGVGNVMLDIARYLIRELKVKEVTAVARRGPDDVKFDKKEMEAVASNLDVEALEAEIERTAPVMRKVGQDPGAAKAFILSALEKAQEPVSDAIFRLDFLASPRRILGDEDGNVTGLEVEDTTLELREGSSSTRAVGLGHMRVIEADTVIFCIGDRVDPTFGLPLDKWGEFAKHPRPQFPVEGISFEAYDPEKDEAIEGVFLAGWAREASSGLVGTARKDGTNGAKAVLDYLEALPPGANAGEAFAAIEARLNASGKPVVRKADVQRLEAIETARAEQLGLEAFKFSTNEEMLEAMGMMEQAPQV